VHRRLVMFSESRNTTWCWLALNKLLHFAFCHPLKGVPRGNCAKCTFHVHWENLQTVDVGCVNPSETISYVSEQVCRMHHEQTDPSVATPLKSLP
jgi:hypothetical protein